jgi:hypothetical protein
LFLLQRCSRPLCSSQNTGEIRLGAFPLTHRPLRVAALTRPTPQDPTACRGSGLDVAEVPHLRNRR